VVYNLFAVTPSSSIFQHYSKSKIFPHPIVRMGLQTDWPHDIHVQTHFITTLRLSSDGKILVTGGRREDLPVFALWDPHLSEGKISVHPCRRLDCWVEYVSFAADTRQLTTGCSCGVLCDWDTSMYPPVLLKQRQLEINGLIWKWAEDGSKFIMDERMDITNESQKLIFTLSFVRTPAIYHTLHETVSPLGWRPGFTHPEHHWKFSPGSGDRVILYKKAPYNGKLMLWECLSGKQLFQILIPVEELEYGECCFCFSPDIERVIFSFPSKSISLISKEGSLLWHYEEETIYRGACFLPTGEILVRTADDICIRNPLDGRILRTIKRRLPFIFEFIYDSVFVSPDEQRIAIVSNDKLEIFDSRLDVCLQHYNIQSINPRLACFSWATLTLFLMELDSISFYHMSLEQPNMDSLKDPTIGVSSIKLSPNGLYLLVIHWDNVVALWETASSSAWTLGPLFEENVQNIEVSFSDNSSYAILWSKDCDIMVVETASGQIHSVKATEAVAATFLPVSKRILVIEQDNNLKSLSFINTTCEYRGKLTPLLGSAQKLVASPSEQAFAVIGSNGVTIRKDLDTGDGNYAFSGTIYDASFSPEDSHLCILSEEYKWKTVIYIDLLNGQYPLMNFRPKQLQVKTIRIDGRWIFAITFGCHYTPEFDDIEATFTIFLHCLDGRQLIPAVLCQSGYGILYGNEELTILDPVDYRSMQLSGNYVASINERNQAFVVDYSLMMSEKYRYIPISYVPHSHHDF
jgi:WD40 repeat protein